MRDMEVTTCSIINGGNLSIMHFEFGAQAALSSNFKLRRRPMEALFLVCFILCFVRLDEKRNPWESDTSSIHLT